MIHAETGTSCAVRCSIILRADHSEQALSNCLGRMGDADLARQYEVIAVADQQPRPDELGCGQLAAVRILDSPDALAEEQVFDRGAMAALGQYLLLVRSLAPVDPVILDESIRELGASTQGVSVSEKKNFILIDRLEYARIGGFASLSEGLLLGDRATSRRITPRSETDTGPMSIAGSPAGSSPASVASPGAHYVDEWQQKYSLLREPKVASRVQHVGQVNDLIEAQLRQSGFDVRDLQIDISDYDRYVQQAQLYADKKYYGGYQGPSFPEKSLEHYLAAKLLELNPADVYIDVASMTSPVPEVYAKLFGCRTYRQDLSYRPGVTGDRIGGDAAAMPVPDGFATKMGLHCSFEHFEGDSDIRFLAEAQRVLRPGGRVCILPLYLFSEYAIQTDPAVVTPEGIAFEPDAVLYCAKGYRNRHGRFYDVPHLVSRVRDNLGTLSLTIFVVRNAEQVHPSCYVRFVALLEKNRFAPG